ncbi:MAG TPA: prepilin peptidase [Nitriliruptorales bacterium]
MSTLAGVAICVLGLLVGSFANVAIHRWPRGGSVNVPNRSVCPACEQPIAARDNIPVVSWLRLGGRCRHCGEPIAVRYLLVEVATGLLFLAVALVHGDTPWLLPALLALTWSLVVATATDLEHRRIPNVLTLRLPLVLTPLLLLAAWQAEAWTDLRRALIAGVAVPAGMFAFSELFRLLRGKQGIGMGDVKLAISLGLVLGYLGGWELVIWFYGTAVSGALVAGVLVVSGRASMASRIPFGPYLALGAMVAILLAAPLTSLLEPFFTV